MDYSALRVDYRTHDGAHRRVRRTSYVGVLLALAMTLIAGPAFSEALVNEAGNTLVIGNDRVGLTIHKPTGTFLGFESKDAGLARLMPNNGSWPFVLRLGSSRSPNLIRVEFSTTQRHQQEATSTWEASPDGMSLVFDYADLLTTGGNPTGVAMTVSTVLGHDADYFKIQAHLSNTGIHEVTSFASGDGGFVVESNAEAETLAVPGWELGRLYANPRDFFTQPETWGYPVWGTNSALNAGWMDLYGPAGGIGIGYLNPQGCSMRFNVAPSSGGLQLNWQLFNLLPKRADGWESLGVGGVYGIEPGQEFTTGTWLLAPHGGDWHRMADIYRTEYEQAFGDDYLNWERTSDTAKKVDLITIHSVDNFRDTPDVVETPFVDVPGKVRAVIEDSGVLPENLLVVLLATSDHWPLHMPDHLPVSEAAGGELACRDMMAELSSMGVNSVQYYAHLFYNHPQATDYVVSAETHHDHPNVAWNEIGNVANPLDAGWQDLWTQKYIPGWRDLGVSSIYLDQGPVQYLVPVIQGASAIDMLSAHTAGIIQLCKNLRNGVAGAAPYLWTEVGSDLTARWVDIWTNGDIYASGGVITPEIVRYTFPYKLVFGYSGGAALADGFITSYQPLVGEAAEAQRQYVRLRRDIREARAPGYPQGYRGTVGLSWADPNLVVRSYRDATGISVVYYAKETVDTAITVSPAALGLAGQATVVLPIRLKAQEAGYYTISSENG